MSNTTIILKNSGTSSNVPSSLQPGEIAINHADGKLYYGNNANQSVLLEVLAEPSGLDTEVQFNDLGILGASSGFTYNKTTETLTITNIVSTAPSSGTLLDGFNIDGGTY